MRRFRLLIVFLYIFLCIVPCFSEIFPQDLKIHFLDVGQADCILIQTPNNKNILVDAGNSDNAESIISYIDILGIKQIDAIIGTHPHADHIGGMSRVLKRYSIGNIFMPLTSNNTASFRDLLLTIKNIGKKVTTAKKGVLLDIDPALSSVFLAPNNSFYSNLNDYSAVLKISYKNTTFLLVGDASITSEEEMLRSGIDLKCDVLKVGHHGSNSSSSEAFLSATSPKYAVISVGKYNSYGHPSEETINRLLRMNIQVFRTDLNGTIVFRSDGETITFDKLSSPIKPNAPPSGIISKPQSSTLPQDAKDDTIVYITRTGKKYHIMGCRYLSRSCIPIGLKQAKERGYLPCKVCKPPQ